MSEDIVIYRDTNYPSVPFEFPDLDLTGAELELKITPSKDATPTVFPITPDDAHSATWAFTLVFIGTLSAGRGTTYDLVRIQGSNRDKIAAGRVWVKVEGEYDGPNEGVTFRQGPPGPKGDTGDGINVILHNYADWPPAADSNPLNWHVRTTT